MADETDIAIIGVQVDSSQVDASTASLDRWLAKGAEVEAMLARLQSSSASAMAKVSPAMLGVAGPSAAGGSVANPFGPQWQQTVADAATHTAAFSAALGSPTAALAGLDASAKGALAALDRIARWQAPTGQPAPGGSPAAPSAPSAPHPSAPRRPGGHGGVPGQDEFEREADALRAKLDPLAAAHMHMSDQVARYSELLRRGAIDQKEYGQAVTMAGKAFQEEERHLRHGGGLGRNSMMELQHVGRATFDEFMATGQILRPLMMEAPRIMEALGGGQGGIGGALNVVKNGLGALMNPAALAAGALVAVGAAAAFSFASYESQQAKLSDALNGIGRRSGATVGQLRAAGIAGAAAGDLSNSEGVGLAATYAHAGLSASTAQGLIGITRDYGRLTGQETDKAGGALAAAIADPVRGLGQLDKELGFVDGALQLQVDGLARSGHIAEAQSVAMEALRKAVEDTTDSTYGWKKALEGAENWMSNKFGGLGGAIASAAGLDSPAEQLARLRAQLPQTGRGFFDVGDRNTDNVLGKIAVLEREVAAEEARAAANKRDADAATLSKQGLDAIKTLVPEAMRAETAGQTIELLRQVVSDPDIMRRVGVSPATAQRAYGDAVVMAANADPDRRTRQDYDIRMAGIGEMDVENRGLLDARKAELAVLRQTGDAVRAQAAAQMSLNEAIEAANVDAAEKLRLAQQETGLIGLTGVARQVAEIRNRFEGPDGEIERNTFSKGGTNVLDDDDIRADLRGSGAKLAAALGESGPKIEAAGEGAGKAITAAGEKLATAIEGVGAKVAALPMMIGAPGGPAAPFATSGPFGALTPMGPGASVQHGGMATAPMLQLMTEFVRRGVDPAAAAGFVAGTTTESGTMLDPTANNGSHIGIAQWDAARWKRIVDAYGPAAMNRQGQAAGMFLELGTNEAGAGRILAGSNSILGGIYASDAYERPGDVEAARRRPVAIARANALLAAYPGGAGVSDASPLTVHPADVPLPPERPAEFGGTAAGSAVAPIASTAADKLRTLEGVTISNATQGANISLLQSGGNQVADLTEQIRLQGETFGATTAKIAEMTAESKLLTQARHEMISMSPPLRAAIHEEAVTIGDLSAKLQAQAELQKDVMGVVDTFRGGLTSSLSSGIVAAAHGKSFGDALRGGLSSLGDSLINRGVGMIGGGLFGQQGQGNGGLLGSLFGGLFEHHAGGGAAPGNPFIAGESGPELIDAPKGAQILTADQTSGMRAMGGGGAPAQPLSVAVHIHPVGGAQFTPDQVRSIRGEVTQGVLDGHAQLKRDWAQYQSDSLQTG